MRKITIEIDGRFGDILSVTVVGNKGGYTSVAVGAVDIQKYNKITFDHDGRMEFYNDQN